MALLGLLKSAASLQKGLVFTGSLGSIFSFLGLGEIIKGREWEYEITSTLNGMDWENGLVTPLFNSSWLGGGFEKKTKYSYGYIGRVAGTDFYKSENASKRVKGDREGRLTLIEKIGEKTVIEDTNNKERKGLTPKKFLLIGSNSSTGEIEVTGLVSLIQYEHKGIKGKCKLTEEKGAIQNGYCDKVIFKEYEGDEESKKAPGFIKTTLKSEDGKRDVSIIGLSQKNGSLGVVWGSRMANNNQEGLSTSESGIKTAKWSRTGYLYQNHLSKKKKLKVWTALQDTAKGFFVVHDLKFSEKALNYEWRKKHETHGNILEAKARQAGCTSSTKSNCLKVVDISLSTNRNYWIWDPSKTKIKNGKFVTDDGIKLPFNLRFDTPWHSKIVK